MATRSDALSVSVRKDFHTVAHSSGIALDEATRALAADVGKVHGEVNWVALTYAKGSKQADAKQIFHVISERQTKELFLNHS
jgi:hypothetical protein